MHDGFRRVSLEAKEMTRNDDDDSAIGREGR